MSETASFDSYNVKDEMNLFAIDHAKFVRKYAKNDELQESGLVIATTVDFNVI